jgi:hypothetical protein
MFILSGCGGGGPTFDASSEESAEASLAAMFPEWDFSGDSDNEDVLLEEGFPPGLETYSCVVMQMAFADFGSDEKPIPTQFDGMTAADMAAYGVENDLVGCMQEFLERVQEMNEEISEINSRSR